VFTQKLKVNVTARFQVTATQIIRKIKFTLSLSKFYSQFITFS